MEKSIRVSAAMQRRAKAVAAEQGTSLKAFTEAALEVAMRTHTEARVPAPHDGVVVQAPMTGGPHGAR